MISAAGRPNLSSPFSRSLADISWKSRSRVCEPVIATANAGSASARSTASTTDDVPSSSQIASGISVACRSAETSESSSAST